MTGLNCTELNYVSPVCVCVLSLCVCYLGETLTIFLMCYLCVTRLGCSLHVYSPGWWVCCLCMLLLHRGLIVYAVCDTRIQLSMCYLNISILCYMYT